MMKLNITILFLFCTISVAFSQVNLDYYLPDSTEYNPSIPTPKSVIRHEVGEWHVTHDRLVHYMKTLAASSDRVTIKETGETYEGRPQLLLTITHPDNQQRIEEIRTQHKQLTNPSESSQLNTDGMPIVVWMGYSIHGNEASGSNASMLSAYYFAAAENAGVEEMLKDVVIVLDPSFNPDGMNRFATWVNVHKNDNITTDPNDREYNEVWPGGRTNHYWFDLNRDWMPAQLVESQNRIKEFHRWKPNILTDHHEMGTNSTFFFQPGIPSRTHPLTPDENQELTAEIGDFHARALDGIGSLYYTKENYDDFYYGKGSTFPDVQGAIGILFEQASSRGHAQESINGVLRFPFTIKNQFTTSLSTFQAAHAMRKRLLDYQRSFYQQAQKEASNAATNAWVVSSTDKSKLYHFAEMLQRHEIKVHKAANSIDNMPADETLVIPTDQYQYKLITAMFEKRTSFEDSLFYDVSAWTLPLAFNLEYKSLSGRAFNTSLLGDELTEADKPTAKIEGGKANYAYIFEWNDYYTPKVLHALQRAGLTTCVSTEIIGAPDGKSYPVGSIMVPVTIQDKSANEIYAIVQQAINGTGVTIHSLNTGNTGGIKLGSPSLENLQAAKIGLMIGEGIRSYDAGEIWHLLDQRYNMPITKLDITTLSYTNLNRYNVIILPDGWGYGRESRAASKLKEWVQNGGTLIAYKGAAKWLSSQGITKVKYKSGDNDTTGTKPYADLNNNRGAQVIGGAIFEATLDLSHPLAYGYTQKTLPVFRNGDYFMEKSKNPYANPLIYTDSPLLSGYISEEKLDQLQSTPAITVSRNGGGRVISFTDNTNFRAFWYGTNRLLMNAIFFGQTISGRSAE